MRPRQGCDARHLLQMLGEALHKECTQWKPFKVYKSSIKKGIDISPTQRNESVQWLNQLNHKFHFYPETFFLSTAIMDRFLQTVKANPKYRKCIGIACFYLAAKTLEEDEVLPGTLELVRESRCGCSLAEVLRMERCILNKLGWDLRAVTPLDFLHLFHALLLSNNPHLLDVYLHMTPSRQLALMTKKLEMCMSSVKLAGAFSPAVVALAVLSLELEMCVPDWLAATLALQTIGQVNNKDLIHCRERITCHLNQSSLGVNSVRIYVPKMGRKNAVSNRPTKRKVVDDERENDEDDDICDGIKCLYDEDPFDAVPAAAVMATTCGEEARQEDGGPSLSGSVVSAAPLQALAT